MQSSVWTPSTQGTPESLYQTDRHGVGTRLAKPVFMDDMGCQDAVNDTQHFAHQGPITDVPSLPRQKTIVKWWKLSRFSP
jgi:hypothetical protein